MTDGLDDYVADQYRPLGDGESQRILLALLRRIAAGRPVTGSDLAARLGFPPKRIEAAIDALPASWLDRDGGRITGFAGLGQTATRHRLTTETQTLYAWCAFDCLFLPEVLDTALEVHSTCPATGTPIALDVGATGVLGAVPQTTRMSFVTPAPEARRDDLRGAFCRHINFYADADAAAAWQSENPEGLILDLERAHDLGRRRNAALFGAALAA